MTELDRRWSQFDNILSRPSPFGNETGLFGMGEFTPGQELVEAFHTKKVLVIGIYFINLIYYKLSIIFNITIYLTSQTNFTIKIHYHASLTMFFINRCWWSRL
jgi:hypothetical protein